MNKAAIILNLTLLSLGLLMLFTDLWRSIGVIVTVAILVIVTPCLNITALRSFSGKCPSGANGLRVTAIVSNFAFLLGLVVGWLIIFLQKNYPGTLSRMAPLALIVLGFITIVVNSVALYLVAKKSLDK